MDSANVILVLEKTVSPVKDELQMAQQYLEQAMEHDIASFLSALSDVIVGVQHSVVSRIQAGLQIKNALYSKDPDILKVKRDRWTMLPIEIRDRVKKNILNTLGTETVRPSSAAVCIAQVACIDLPLNQWPQLIGILTGNVTALGSTEMMKESSLETIGYICQDIAPEMLASESNVILTAIVHGMKKDESSNVKLAATNSLFNSLEFTRANFDMETERHFIMQVVCDATQCSTTSVKVASLQCLVKIMSLYYVYMEHYMAPALFAISVEAMKSEVTEVALQGIEFWSNVCDEEVDLAIELTEAIDESRAPEGTSKHYAKGALQYLLPILTDTLCKQDDADDDEDWNPYKAAGVCLVLLANCCGDDVVNQVVSFVSNNITDPDWKKRDAAIMSFGSIIEGPTLEVLLPLCRQALPTLVALLSDPSVEVRDTTAWTLGRICEIVPDSVLVPETITPLMESFILGLDSVPRVASNICWALNSIAEAAYQIAESSDDSADPTTYMLSPYYESIVQKLLQTTDRPDSNQKNLRSSAYEALMEFIKNSPIDCYISVQKTAMVILERLERVVELESSVASQSDRSQYNDLQSNLCATLQSVLRKVKPEDAPIISDSIMKALLNMLNNKQAYGVQEDAMQAISSLIEVMGENFNKYTDSLHPFLMSALQLYSEEQMCIVAIGMVSDLCRAITSSISIHMDSIMVIFLEILSSNTASNKIKPHILSSFGDVALAMGPNFVKYIDVTMNTLRKVPMDNAERGDYDRIDYLNELREACIDAYAGILQGLRSEDDLLEISADLKLLIPFVPDMLNYLSYISSIQFDVADCVYASSCGLIGDLAFVFKADIKERLNVESILNITTKARRSKVPKTRQLGSWANKEVRKLTKKPLLNR